MNLNPIRRLPSNLRARRPNQLEQERENSERNQEASYRKAINDEEVPVKMKHVRLLILATHNEKNAVTFWRLAQLFNPLSTDVTAWKFCHCLHMIIRDGHKHVIKDTLRNIDMVKNVRQHFYHLTHGYGRLIVRYCDLLLCKVQFHQRNPRFPSNLSVSPDELHSIAETDANNYFELAVEMFEYTECILKLYTEVFSSLDQSRAVSNTKMGQCRLAPLITCIQDSTSIYDLTVRIMFNLHKALTVDLLVGHRERFNQQFPQLHLFYENSANLQYFKTLNITIPQLPREPPNFLIEAELHSHVAPVVVLQPEIDDTVTEPDEMPVNELSLVDTSDGPPPVPPHPDFSRDASMIESLTKELEDLRLQLQQTRSQESHSRQQMAHTINDLQATIASLESSLLSEKQAKESVMVQVEAAAVGAEAVTKLAHEEKQRKLYEDKFNKMREVYHNFRDEHVTLIRSKAEVEGERDGERSAREVLETSVNRLEEQINNQEETVKQMRATSNEERDTLLARVSELQNSLDNAIGSADKQREELTNQLNAVEEDREALMKQRVDLLDRLQEVESELERTIREAEEKSKAAAAKISSLEEEKDDQCDVIRKLQAELEELRKKIESLTAERDHLLSKVAECEMEIEKLEENVEKLNNMIKDLESDKEKLIGEINNLEKQLVNVREELDENKDQLRKTEQKLGDTLLDGDKLMILKNKMCEQNAVLEVKVSELEELRDQLLQSQTKLHDNISSLTTDLTKKSGEIAAFIRQVSRLNLEKSSLETDCAKLQSELEQQCATNHKLGVDINTLTDEREKLKEELRIKREECDTVGEMKRNVEVELTTAAEKLQNTIGEITTEKISMNAKCLELEEKLSEITELHAKKCEEKENVEQLVQKLQRRLQRTVDGAEKEIAKSQHTTELQVQACVRACCATSAKILTQTMQRAASEKHAEINSTPEFTLTFEAGIRTSMSSIPALVGEYLSSHVAHAPSLISTLEDFTLLLSSFIMYATAASHVSADIEKAHELVCSVQSLGEQSTALLSAVQDSRTVQDNIDTIATTFDRCVSLVSWCVDSSISTDDIAEQMEREMEAMRRAIAEASASTASMLEKARKQDTGLKLEVNESLLGICMELFSAVQILVLRAAELQQEVASKSNAGASPKEFYKRNHRWTQGLITGAKAVAIACQALMSAADAVVSKGGRFEEVIVSSREIAASSMQLVMASRVKADPSSNNLKNVNGAAKNISTLTGNLVATAESCRDKVSTVALDFSQLSLHQSKRLEMDTLVKVLEAEKHLEQQREKLGQLRKHHYQLAGEMEERQRGS